MANPPSEQADREPALESLADLAALRLVLVGESPIDLPRLWFADRAAVDGFLRLALFDTDNPLDLARLRELHAEATEYLTDVHHYRMPEEVARPPEIHDLFLLATHGVPRLRRFACMTLKVMHILNHIHGQELAFNTSISEAQILERLNSRVFTLMDRMRAAGIGVMEFSSGKKTRHSLITKLLARRSTLASQIFDRVRFGITVRTREDVVRAVLYMVRHVFPFNYVVPEQSRNGIITLGDIIEVLGIDPQVVWEYWNGGAPQPPEDATAPTPVNEFSGPTYRCVNFVVDIPLRIDDVAPSATPAIISVQTEIQLVDAATHAANEEGENAHASYKKRQYERVRARIEAASTNRKKPR